MSSKFNLDAFLKLSPEEQAKSIEKQTTKLLNRLPSLKKALKMYGDTTDELYNLTSEEVSLIGSTYANAVREGEITTPSSKQAYRKFINDLRRYTRVDVSQIARETAQARLDSWLEHLKANASQAEIDYAQQLINSMSESEKLGFTRSQYFLDVANWDSDQFKEFLQNSDYSIMTLKLELYLQKQRANNVTDVESGNTKNYYNEHIATDGENKVRAGTKGRRVYIKKGK